LQDTFDYSSAEGQLLLHSYHEAFHHVGAIVKMPVGHCPGFWLQSFRSWLISRSICSVYTFSASL